MSTITSRLVALMMIVGTVSAGAADREPSTQSPPRSALCLVSTPHCLALSATPFKLCSLGRTCERDGKLYKAQSAPNFSAHF